MYLIKAALNNIGEDVSRKTINTIDAFLCELFKKFNPAAKAEFFQLLEGASWCGFEAKSI